MTTITKPSDILQSSKQASQTTTCSLLNQTQDLSWGSGTWCGWILLQTCRSTVYNMSGPCAFTSQSSGIQSKMAVTFEKLVPWRITLDDKAQTVQNHTEDTDASLRCHIQLSMPLSVGACVRSREEVGKSTLYWLRWGSRIQSCISVCVLRGNQCLTSCCRLLYRPVQWRKETPWTTDLILFIKPLKHTRTHKCPDGYQGTHTTTTMANEAHVQTIHTHAP